MNAHEIERQMHRCAIILPPSLARTGLFGTRSIDEAIRTAAERGYTTFVSGMNRCCELEGAQEALRLGALSDVRVVCALPYPEYGLTWQDRQDQAKLQFLLKHADLVRAISPANHVHAEWMRYKWMLDRCTRLITCPPEEHGAPLYRQCLQYGHARELDIQFIRV